MDKRTILALVLMALVLVVTPSRAAGNGGHLDRTRGAAVHRTDDFVAEHDDRRATSGCGRYADPPYAGDRRPHACL